MQFRRRAFLLTPMLCASAGRAADVDDAARLLAEGGAVAAFRHTLAPGTFDPPGFKIGDCSTQRNLSEEGRAQARELGAWFANRQLRPALVRSSPWCRCVDTAMLAFGAATVWPALGSPSGQTTEVRNARQQGLRLALRAVHRQRGARGVFEVWVTHQFVLSDLAQVALAPGEGLVLRADPSGAPQVLARIIAA